MFTGDWPVERDTDSARVAQGGVFDSAKRLAASIVAHLHTRLAEFAEEKLRLTTLLYSVLTALFFYDDHTSTAVRHRGLLGHALPAARHRRTHLVVFGRRRYCLE